LQQLIGDMQAQRAKWVINTGRDMSSLMEALGRSKISIEPDFLVLVEREIHLHQDSQYLALEEWNSACTRCHAELFARVHADLPRIVSWSRPLPCSHLRRRFFALCLIAGAQ
jgi:hypothetical protein